MCVAACHCPLPVSPCARRAHHLRTSLVASFLPSPSLLPLFLRSQREDHLRGDRLHREASNGRKFARNFRDFPWSRCPTCTASSERVLTMVRTGDQDLRRQLAARKGRPDQLARQSGEAFMIQLLRRGFFCDPHPGNIAVDGKGPGEQRLVFYDFGMVDTLSEDFRRALVDGFFALYEGDSVQAPKQIVQHSSIPVPRRKGRRLAVESIARYFLSFRERLALDRSLPISNAEKDQMRMDACATLATSWRRCVRQAVPLPACCVRAARLQRARGGGRLDPDYDGRIAPST